MVVFPDLNDGSCVSIFSVDAAYRFYRSHREEQSLKRRGKSDIKQKKKRRHERKLRVRRLEYYTRNKTTTVKAILNDQPWNFGDSHIHM